MSLIKHMGLPQIKKTIQKFLLDETGIISKKDILKLGSLLSVASLSTSVSLGGGADCAGSHCDSNFGDGDFDGSFTLTDDMKIIAERGGGNIIQDTTTHINDTQAHGSGHVFGAWDECHTTWGYTEAGHGNCWWCWIIQECCVEFKTGDTHEHWNAVEHLNGLNVSSEDSLNILAEHDNYVAIVHRDIFAYDLCGYQHASVGNVGFN
jgi:hypothetical protein